MTKTEMEALLRRFLKAYFAENDAPLYVRMPYEKAKKLDPLPGLCDLDGMTSIINPVKLKHRENAFRLAEELAKAVGV